MKMPAMPYPGTAGNSLFMLITSIGKDSAMDLLSKMIAVTDRHVFDSAPDPEEAFFAQLARIFRAGPRAVVLREKDLSPEAYLALASKVLSLKEHLCTGSDVPLILHGFPEAARALGISAIHLPLSMLLSLHEKDPSFLSGFRTVGASVHSPEDARAAVSCGASYLFAGNVWETGCKPGKAAAGLEYLRSVVSAVDVPVYGIGGVTPERMPQILETGAAGGCMMSGFMKYGL